MEGGDVLPRRSLRLALTEINEISTSDTETNSEGTPAISRTSPDEMVIVLRGRRRKPIVWSPVDYDRTRLLRPTRDRTPERALPAKSDMNPKLRRRLVMSPGKHPTSQDLGLVIASKLKALRKLELSDRNT